MANNFTEFKLPTNAYSAFDAVSMKQLIKNRLVESNLFTDVNFEGSNISGLVDVIAYTYHVLLFHLNQTASESLFSQADILENMNKIVSLIGYNPRGATTSQLKVSASASDELVNGLYSIKRFSYTQFNNIRYTFANDITFEKTDSSEIPSIGDGSLMFQGTIKEYPTYTAFGDSFERVVVNITYPITDNTRFIDTNNIFVFVKNVETGLWEEGNEVSNVFISRDKIYSYEKRYNDNGHYELKFGDGVHGKKLNVGDIVAIYYLESDGTFGVIGSDSINNSAITPFNTVQYNEILEDISTKTYATVDELSNVTITNELASIPPTSAETVDDIRETAPSLFSSQNRLVTESDYTTFVKRNFSNFIQDAVVMSNDEYASEYLAYFYEIGLERPNIDQIGLLNQLKFRNACDFNNVYIFCVPKTSTSFATNAPTLLFDSQKQFIVDDITPIKMINHNLVIADPVFIYFGFGVASNGEEHTSDIINNTKIIIKRSPTSLVSLDGIKQIAYRLILDFFAPQSNKLGGVLDFNKLSNDILSINGVAKLETETIINGISTKFDKLGFVYWNPIYQSVPVKFASQNVVLEKFQFPALFDDNSIFQNITVL